MDNVCQGKLEKFKVKTENADLSQFTATRFGWIDKMFVMGLIILGIKLQL